MKKFEDLQFEKHPTGFGKHAIMEFKNGYGVSVVFGNQWYSNGIDTYEIAILKDGRLTYSTHITDDVLGYQTKHEVSEIMKQVQEL